MTEEHDVLMLLEAVTSEPYNFPQYNIFFGISLLKCIVKKKLKSNIIYNSASRVIRTHVLTSAESVEH